MRKEEWRAVEGYFGRYEVSDMGRVRSRDHVDAIGRVRRGRILKPIKHSNGYRYVNLHFYGEVKRMYVHRLVAEAFLGKGPAGFDVDHINKDRSDNTLSNLRYLSVKKNRGQSAKSKRKRVQKISKGGNVIAVYPSIKRASVATGIHRACISGVINGKCMTAGGFIWRAEPTGAERLNEKSI